MDEVTKKEPAPVTIRTALADPKVLAQIQRALPAHMAADRMARIAITAVTKAPKLNQCTVASFMRCLLDLSAVGLEPDGRHAHLIPYKTECTLVIDYKGLVALAYRSGEVQSIHADVIFVGDDFAYSLGKVERHTPWAFRQDAIKPSEQGLFIGAYAMIELKNGAHKHELMTKSDIDAIRKRSRSGGSGPWVTDYNEMSKKTVFRRASKWIPLSSEVARIIEIDNDRPDFKTGQARRSALSDIVPARIEEVDKCKEIAAFAIMRTVNANDIDAISDAVGMALHDLEAVDEDAAKKKEAIEKVQAAAARRLAEIESK